MERKSSENVAKLTLKENSKSKIIYPVDIETVDNTYSEMCSALLHLAISWRTLVSILLFFSVYFLISHVLFPQKRLLNTDG